MGKLLLTLACALLLAGTGPAFGDTIIDNTAGSFSTVQPFGETNTATYGQTFRTPSASDTVLKSFSLYFDDFLNPDFVDFGAYVMEWTGDRATGAVFYDSGLRTSSNNGGAGGYEEFTFTPNVALDPLKQYVAFLNVSNYFDGAQGTSIWRLGGDSYADGAYVFENNGNNFGALTAQPWDFTQGTGDTAFKMTFGPAAVAPLPAALAGGMALMGLTAVRRRKRLEANA